jgi:putative transposase
MKWKKQLLEELPSIFSDKRAKTEKEREDLEAELYRQCELIGLPSSSYYYEAREESEYNLLLMRLIDEEYSRALFYDTRRMTVFGRIEIQYSGS